MNIQFPITKNLFDFLKMYSGSLSKEPSADTRSLQCTVCVCVSIFYAIIPYVQDKSNKKKHKENWYTGVFWYCWAAVLFWAAEWRRWGAMSITWRPPDRWHSWWPEWGLEKPTDFRYLSQLKATCSLGRQLADARCKRYDAGAQLDKHEIPRNPMVRYILLFQLI
jgi:hypothetical protein